MSGRLTLAVPAGAAGGWLAFVWATTHWYSWQQTIDLLFGSDAQEYETSREGGAGLPGRAAAVAARQPLRAPLPGRARLRRPPRRRSAPLLRLRVPLLLGLIVWSWSTGCSRRSGCGRIEWALCVGALVDEPVPVPVPRDLRRDGWRTRCSSSAALVALLGLLRANPWLLVGGLVVATLGRSESVFPLAVARADRRARSRRTGERATRPRSLGRARPPRCVVPLGVYGLIVIADDSFSRRDHPGFWGLTIFGTLRDLPEAARARSGSTGSRIVIGVVGRSGADRRRARRPVARAGAREARRSPFWAALVAGIAVSGEALILSPGFIHGNSPLLSALGAAFFVVAAGGRARRTWSAGSVRAGAVGARRPRGRLAPPPVQQRSARCRRRGSYAAVLAATRRGRGRRRRSRPARGARRAA